MAEAPLPIVRGVADLREAVAGFRGDGARVALVPTMGALHAAHLALVHRARAVADRVVASVFVNPKQFGPAEDFARYPRQEAADAAALAGAGCDLLYAPDAAAMYPSGFASGITVAGVTARWEGAIRPGHFAGVATVVAKLLLQATPDVALFGEKDWQQLQTIRRMVADLDMAVAIEPMPIVRDAHGLALSSRNAYLSPAGLKVARRLNRVLNEVAAALRDGIPASKAEADGEAALLAAGFQSVDYLALVEPETLEPLPTFDGTGRLIAAARLESVRLLDNREV